MEGPASPRRPALLLAAQIGAVVALNATLALVLIETASVELGAVLGLPAVGRWSDALADWAALAAVPTLVRAALVAGRLAVGRSASAFWFVGAAVLVAGLAFAVALARGLAAPGAPALGALLWAWQLVPCAAAVAALTRLASRRRPAGD